MTSIHDIPERDSLALLHVLDRYGRTCLEWLEAQTFQAAEDGSNAVELEVATATLTAGDDIEKLENGGVLSDCGPRHDGEHRRFRLLVDQQSLSIALNA